MGYHTIVHLYHESNIYIYICMVGGWAYPSEKYEFVNQDDEIPNTGKNGFKPPTRQESERYQTWIINHDSSSFYHHSSSILMIDPWWTIHHESWYVLEIQLLIVWRPFLNMFVSAPNFVPWTKRSFRKPVIPRFTHFLLSAVENQVAGAVHFAQLAAYSTVRIWKCPESLQIGFDLRPADGNLFLGINRWKVSTNGPSMIKIVFSNFRSQFPDQLWQLYGRHMIYGYIC